MPATIDHVAILVANLEQFLATLPTGTPLGKIETYPASGTKECYVGNPDTHGALLLAMEAIGPGPYQRALHKRGPGLHHIAVVTHDLDAYGGEVAATAVLLHPASLHTLKHGGLWLCRPGMPFLIEVVQVPAAEYTPGASRFITGVELAMDTTADGIARALLPDFVTRKIAGPTRLMCADAKHVLTL